MKGFAIGLAALCLPLAANAAAAEKKLGDAGVIELGGTFSIASNSDNQKVDGGGGSTKTTETNIQIGPDVGYFLAPNIELLGSLAIGLDNVKQGSNKDNTTTFGLGAGGGYYMQAGPGLVGPDLLLTYISVSDKADNGGGSSTVAVSGPGAKIGGTFKIPVGSGGVINIGLHYVYEGLKFTVTGGIKGSDTVGDLNTDVGFSVFF